MERGRERASSFCCSIKKKAVATREMTLTKCNKAETGLERGMARALTSLAVYRSRGIALSWLGGSPVVSNNKAASEANE